MYYSGRDKMSGIEKVNRKATRGRRTEVRATARAPEPVTVTDPGYGVRLPTRRSPSTAQAVLLASAAAQLLLALLVTIYLARVISPAAFGFFSLVSTIFILARRFLDLGLSSVAARDIASNPQRERPILEGLMAYRRVAGIVLALSLFIFAFSQRTEAQRAILLGVGVVLLLTEPAALDPVFQVRQAQEGPAVVTAFGSLFLLCGCVLFGRLGLTGVGFAWLLIIREAMILLFTQLLARRLLGYYPKAGFHGRALHAFIAPALLFGLASLVYTIYFHCDVFFVDALRGQAELGAYAAAFRPINPLLLLPWLLMVPMVPVLTIIVAKDRERFVRQVRTLCNFALGLGACAIAGGTLLAPELVQLLYRGRYLSGPLSCVGAFRWLAIGVGQVCVTSVLTASFLADRKEKLLLKIGIGALLVNAALNLILLRNHNFTAAGFATAATELLYLICALIGFQLVTGRSALTWRSVNYLFPALLMSLILWLVRGGPVLRVTCGAALGVAAAAVILLSPGAQIFRKEMRAASPAI